MTWCHSLNLVEVIMVSIKIKGPMAGAGPINMRKKLAMGMQPAVEANNPGAMPMMKKGGHAKPKHKAKGGHMEKCDGMKKGGHAKPKHKAKGGHVKHEKHGHEHMKSHGVHKMHHEHKGHEHKKKK